MECILYSLAFCISHTTHIAFQQRRQDRNCSSAGLLELLNIHDPCTNILLGNRASGGVQPCPKTIQVTDRARGRISNHTILHQEAFEQLRREWNQSGLDGPFLEAADSCNKYSIDADSLEPSHVSVTQKFPDLVDGGKYYLESSGDWVRTSSRPRCRVLVPCTLCVCVLVKHVIRGLLAAI
jgi:hypothetical protein